MRVIQNAVVSCVQKYSLIKEHLNILAVDHSRKGGIAGIWWDRGNYGWDEGIIGGIRGIVGSPPILWS